MARNPVALNDELFVYSHLSEYVEDELSDENRKKFDEIVHRMSWTDLPQQYAERRGQLQAIASKYAHNEDQLQALHRLIEDDVSRANHEAQEIDSFSRRSTFASAGRALVFSVLLASLFYGVYHFVKPKETAPFKALESLVYEAQVLGEEGDRRIAFPSDSHSDLNRYFSQYPDLGFTPSTIGNLSGPWALVGGTVLDYDVAKILAVKWQRAGSNEGLYLFLFRGKMSDLPASTPGTIPGLTYQTYASDKLNIVAWQVAPQLLGMMMGSRGAPDLAEAALDVVGP